MAEHADGSIIVDTEIDSSGFKAGSTELKSAINSLTNKVQGLGPTFQKAMAGNAKAMGTFESKASALKTKIAELEAKMARLGHARLPTADYKFFGMELDKAKAKLAQLEAREAKMNATGVKQKSNAYKNLQYDITLAKEKIMDLEATMAGMRQNGTAFQMGSATPQYQQMASALAAAKQQMAEMDAATSSVKANASTLPAIGQRIAAAFVKAGSVIKSSVVSGLKMAGTAAKTLLAHTLKAVTGMKVLGNSTRGTGLQFGNLIKSMLFFTVFSAALKSLKEGIDALALSSSSFNNTMSQLITSMAQLRNSLITAFAPILSAVVPILSMLISKLAAAINLIGQFFAALSGGKTYTKAITQQQDYAASLKDTAKKAKSAGKELKRQLAGFDELNILSDSSGGGKGGASADDPGVKFEEMPIESGIAGIVDRIKKAFAEGDFFEIGTIIGEGINKIASFLYEKITSINWEGIGVALAQGLNGIIHSVDWELIGKTIGAYFMARLDVIYGVVKTFNWKAAGAALGTAIMGLWNEIDWAKAGTTLSTAIIGVLDFISQAIKTIDWQKIGNDVALFIASIDWTGIIVSLSDGIGAALGGLAALLWGLIEGAWNSVVAWWQEVAYEDGQFTMEGLLQGIWDGICNIGNWIVKNIFEPFINGFKAAFKIGSPSKVMQEQGGFIISGLLNGITNAWKSITKFFGSALSSLKSTLSKGWESIKSGASTAWSKVSSTVSSAWSTIKSSTSNAGTKIKETVSGAWSKVKGYISDKLSSAKSAASSAWSSMKSTATSQNNSIKSTLSSTWNSIKSTLSTKMSNIKSTMSSTFSTLKSNASTWGKHICENIASGIKNAMSKVKTAATNVAKAIKKVLGFSEPEEGPLSNFHTYMPDMVDLMVKGMKDNQGRAGTAAAGIAQAIADEVQNGDYSVADIMPEGEVNSTLYNFTDKIANSFAELMDRLQSIANSVTFVTPDVVKGAVPYSVAAQANSSKGGTGGSDHDDISSVVIQSVNNATVAIVKAIEDNCNVNVKVDAESMADSIINEINRRTRMNGKSPLVI